MSDPRDTFRTRPATDWVNYGEVGYGSTVPLQNAFKTLICLALKSISQTILILTANIPDSFATAPTQICPYTL